MSERVNIDDIKITSWAAPTAEDIALLESLTDEQHNALLRREIEKGFSSGPADRSDKDAVWREALRRVKAKAHAPDAL